MTDYTLSHYSNLRQDLTTKKTISATEKTQNDDNTVKYRTAYNGKNGSILIYINNENND